MRIFKHIAFHKWSQSENLEDDVLKKLIIEIENGLYEANLGSGLYKKRVAMPGKGKSGGYRILLAYKEGEKAFFIYAFAKNVRINISENEIKIYRKLAKDILTMDIKSLQSMLDNGKLVEVT